MSGWPAKRTPELVERARALRAQGMTHRAIAAELGVSPKTIGLALRYGTNVSREHRSAVQRDLWRDRMFGGEDLEIWNRARIIAAIQAWAKRTGRPPTRRQWRRPNGRRSPFLDPRRASRPSSDTVLVHFGTWNAAIEAAGLTPRYRHRVNGRCKRGHDVNIVGLDSQNVCRECARLNAREYRRRRKTAT